MPLQRFNDKNRKWRRMEEDESVFVYRDGTLEKSSRHNLSKEEDAETLTRVLIHQNPLPHCTLLPIKDIIAWI